MTIICRLQYNRSVKSEKNIQLVSDKHGLLTHVLYAFVNYSIVRSLLEYFSIFGFFKSLSYNIFSI